MAAGATVATYFLGDSPNFLQELNVDGTLKEVQGKKQFQPRMLAEQKLVACAAIDD